MNHKKEEKGFIRKKEEKNGFIRKKTNKGFRSSRDQIGSHRVAEISDLD